MEKNTGVGEGGGQFAVLDRMVREALLTRFILNEDLRAFKMLVK